MKALVLGAGGLLGKHVMAELKGHEVRGLDRAACDIGDREKVLDLTSGAQLIINCAAYTNVDGAEADETGSYRANALGAENAAVAARAHRAKLVHVSTDFVFDGGQTHPYDEFDRPRPQSIYARSKWAGEILLGGGQQFLVRVQGLYGAGGRNFSSKLRELVLARKPLKLDAERRVQPSWARAIARKLVELGESDRYGTYHVSCGGETTWAGFCRRLAERLGVRPGWEEVSTAQLLAPAARPANCLFHHRMLALHGFSPMPDWQVAQDEYLSEMERG